MASARPGSTWNLLRFMGMALRAARPAEHGTSDVDREDRGEFGLCNYVERAMLQALIAESHPGFRVRTIAEP